MDGVRFVGIDVSAKWLDVASRRDGEEEKETRFANTSSGHRQLLKWLTQGGAAARVVLEATGSYSFDLAVALYERKGIDVMVANPRAVKDFAGALIQRAKTDSTAARLLREFAWRMPFAAWTPPEPCALALRSLARRIAALTATRTQERNRLHALRVSAASPPVLVADLKASIRQLEGRVRRLQAEAVRLVASAPTLQRAFLHLRSVRGIATTSAIQLLAELAVLPTDLSARQWVAHAGLDPRPVQSGSSVLRPTRISKVGNAHLRRALFMPALVARRWEPHIRAYADHLLHRDKRPLLVTVAVMRKLLHAIYGMLRTDTSFCGAKFYALAPTA
jgi:transposase